MSSIIGVAALIFIPIVGAFACGFGMIQNGLGRDVWTLTTPEVLRWSLVCISPTLSLSVEL